MVVFPALVLLRLSIMVRSVSVSTALTESSRISISGLRVSAREFYRELCDNLSLIRETIESYMR